KLTARDPGRLDRTGTAQAGNADDLEAGALEELAHALVAHRLVRRDHRDALEPAGAQAIDQRFGRRADANARLAAQRLGRVAARLDTVPERLGREAQNE